MRRLMRLTVLALMFIAVIIVVEARAEEVKIIPYTKLNVNGLEISGPQILELQLPSRLSIQWETGDNSGIIEGVLEGSSFSILKVETTKLIREELRVCDIQLIETLIQVTVAKIPMPDNVSAYIGGVKAAWKYNLGEKAMVIEGSVRGLPVEVNVTANAADAMILRLDAMITEEGCVLIRGLEPLIGPLEVTARACRMIKVIPIKIEPLSAEVQGEERKLIGYQIIGRPLVNETLAVIRIRVEDSEGNPIKARVKMEDGEAIEFDVDGEAIVALPAEKAKLTVEAEGFRTREIALTEENFQSGFVLIRLEKMSLWDNFISMVRNIGGAIMANPIYLIIVAVFVLATLALIISIVR